MPEYPEYSEEHKIVLNSLLNLYEGYLKLAFGVLHHRIISSDADFLYFHGGLSGSLAELLNTIREHTATEFISKLPEMGQVIPVGSLSNVTAEAYGSIQHSFGDLKVLANGTDATGKVLPNDVVALMRSIDSILSGEPLQQRIQLREVIVSDYDGDRSLININDSTVAFQGMQQQDYFNRVMFSYPINTGLSWDQLNDEIERRFGDGDGFSSSDSMKQAMYRINRHIRNIIKTEDDFYTQKRGVFTRHYGPAVD